MAETKWLPCQTVRGEVADLAGLSRPADDRRVAAIDFESPAKDIEADQQGERCSRGDAQAVRLGKVDQTSGRLPTADHAQPAVVLDQQAARVQGQRAQSRPGGYVQSVKAAPPAVRIDREDLDRNRGIDELAEERRSCRLVGRDQVIAGAHRSMLPGTGARPARGRSWRTHGSGARGAKVDAARDHDGQEAPHGASPCWMMTARRGSRRRPPLAIAGPPEAPSAASIGSLGAPDAQCPPLSWARERRAISRPCLPTVLC